MRGKTKIANNCIAAALALCVAVSGASPVLAEEAAEEAEGTPYHVLTAEGTVSDPLMDISIQLDALLRLDGEGARLLTWQGEEINDNVYSGLTYLEGGAYVVNLLDGDINSVGLYSKDGEGLIPCETASISGIDGLYSLESERYLKVIYTTGTTENKEECFVYSSSSYVSLSPSEGDTMYTGYALVYDLENRRFVPGLEVTNPDKYALDICGDMICYEDEEDVMHIYDADGNVLLETDAQARIGTYCMVLYSYSDGVYSVFDTNLQMTYTEAGRFPEIVDGTPSEGYLSRYNDDGSYDVLNLNGEVLLSGCDGVYEAHGSVFRVRASDSENYNLVDLDGTVLYTTSEWFTWLGGGLWCEGTNNGWRLISKDGVLGILLDEKWVSDTDSGSAVFILSDGDYTLQLEDPYPTIYNREFVVAENADGYYGVFDLFTGEQLLDYEYASIKFAGDYLYAYALDGWEIYEVTTVGDWG